MVPELWISNRPARCRQMKDMQQKIQANHHVGIIPGPTGLEMTVATMPFLTLFQMLFPTTTSATSPLTQQALAPTCAPALAPALALALAKEATEALDLEAPAAEPPRAAERPNHLQQGL